MEPTLKVAAVAKRLGVAPATLRTWARRYGLGPPAHTAGAHRQYTPEDLTRLLEMRRLTLEGVAPGEAARIALALEVDPAAAAAAAGITGLSLPVARAVPDGDARRGLTPEAPTDRTPGSVRRRELHHLAPADHAASDRPRDRPTGPAGPGSTNGGPTRLRYPSLDTLTEEAQRLVASARELDGAAMRRRLLALVASAGVVRTWEDVAAPALTAVGDAWAGTGRGCEVEHALSQALLQVLHTTTVTAEEPVSGKALLACTEDEQHSLPLAALAAALAERRVAAEVLGGRVPSGALLDAVRTLRPKIVLLYARCPVPARQARDLDEVEGMTRLLVGGPAWRGQVLPDGAVHAPSLSAAVDQIRLAVRH